MVKKNYAAWHINDHDFTDTLSDVQKLRFFARYAILAPSGHNSQPWQLKFTSNSLRIHLHKSRYLSIDGSGLLSVEPYVSIGTFIETLRLAALGFGYIIAIQIHTKDTFYAELKIDTNTKPQPDLLTAIKTRISNRNPYTKKPIDDALVKALSKFTLPKVKSTVLTNRNEIRFVAQQTEIAIQSIMNKPQYRKELSVWVRSNQTRKYDGMPGFTHGFGHIKSHISRIAVRHAPKHGPQAKKSNKLIMDSSLLIVVRCAEDSKESFINAGRAYTYLCVRANQAGIASSALGAAVLDPVTRESMKEHFEIDDRPIYILRFGHATVRARHSPRYPIEKVISS